MQNRNLFDLLLANNNSDALIETMLFIYDKAEKEAEKAARDIYDKECKKKQNNEQVAPIIFGADQIAEKLSPLLTDTFKKSHIFQDSQKVENKDELIDTLNRLHILTFEINPLEKDPLEKDPNKVEYKKSWFKIAFPQLREKMPANEAPPSSSYFSRHLRLKTALVVGGSLLIGALAIAGIAAAIYFSGGLALALPLAVGVGAHMGISLGFLTTLPALASVTILTATGVTALGVSASIVSMAGAVLYGSKNLFNFKFREIKFKKLKKNKEKLKKNKEELKEGCDNNHTPKMCKLAGVQAAILRFLKDGLYELKAEKFTQQQRKDGDGDQRQNGLRKRTNSADNPSSFFADAKKKEAQSLPDVRTWIKRGAARS